MSTTARADWSRPHGGIAAIAPLSARHPQDGPHCDLRFRVEQSEFVAEIAMNLVMIDWLMVVPREDPERIDASELAALEPRLKEYFGAQMPVTIDGVRVAPLLRDVSINNPDEALLPLFPVSGWRGLRKVSFKLVFPLKSAPNEISIVWPAYPPDLLSVLAAKPPLDIAAEWTADGLRSQILFTRAEPGYTWHRPKGGVAARLESVPVPPAPQPLVPAWATLAAMVLVLAVLITKARGRSWTNALVRGAIGAALVVIVRPAGPPYLAFGSRAAPKLTDDEASKAFEALHANLYRAFDYDEERAVYDALAHSVAGPLLEETYLSVRRALVVEDEGGAMSRVVAVRPLSTKIASQGEIDVNGRATPAFVIESTWQVDGRVTHWGHTHDRTNEYDGRFVVAAEGDGWRIHDAEITRQERVDGGATTPPPTTKKPSAPEDEEL